MLGEPHSALIERIFAECASPLGFAMRGVASWEYDWLIDWRARGRLDAEELVALAELAERVLGRGPVRHYRQPRSAAILERNRAVRGMEYEWLRQRERRAYFDAE